MTAVEIQWREDMYHRIRLIVAVVTQWRKGSVSGANSGNTEPIEGSEVGKWVDFEKGVEVERGRFVTKVAT